MFPTSFWRFRCSVRCAFVYWPQAIVGALVAVYADRGVLVHAVMICTIAKGHRTPAVSPAAAMADLLPASWCLAGAIPYGALNRAVWLIALGAVALWPACVYVGAKGQPHGPLPVCLLALGHRLRWE